MISEAQVQKNILLLAGTWLKRFRKKDPPVQEVMDMVCYAIAAQPDQAEKMGLLRCGTAYNHPQIVTCCLEHGMNPKTRYVYPGMEERPITSLRFAADHGFGGALQALLSGGAVPTKEWGEYPLDRLLSRYEAVFKAENRARWHDLSEINDYPEDEALALQVLARTPASADILERIAKLHEARKEFQDDDQLRLDPLLIASLKLVVRVRTERLKSHPVDTPAFDTSLELL